MKCNENLPCGVVEEVGTNPCKICKAQAIAHKRVLTILANDERATMTDAETILEFINEILSEIVDMTDQEIADAYYEFDY